MVKISLGILFLANFFLIFYQVSASPTKFNESCGINQYLLSNFIPAADEGEKDFGKWPWLVAIYHVSRNNSSETETLMEKLKFKCSGTLISNKHIITAAHCVKKNRHLLPANKIVVSLGKYYLHGNELGSKTLRISKIRRKINSEKFHLRTFRIKTASVDLAILVLRNPVQYTNKIKPICLWSGPHGFKKLVGKKGIVVGWGGNQQLYDDKPHTISASIVSQEMCSRAIMPDRLQKSTFCARAKYGSGPFIGYGGNSLVVLNRESGRFHLRGILINIFTYGRKSFRNLKQYAIYLDVAKHQKWITRQISRELD